VGPFEAHHIRRRSQGGSDDPGNLACLCGFSPMRSGNAEGCHRKHHRGAIEFRRKSGFISFDDPDGPAKLKMMMNLEEFDVRDDC